MLGPRPHHLYGSIKSTDFHVREVSEVTMGETYWGGRERGDAVVVVVVRVAHNIVQRCRPACGSPFMRPMRTRMGITPAWRPATAPARIVGLHALLPGASACNVTVRKPYKPGLMACSCQAPHNPPGHASLFLQAPPSGLPT